MKLRMPQFASPVSLFLGPIFQKEVRVLGRRRGTYIARCLFVAGLLCVLGMFFLGFLSETQSGGIDRLQALQTLAPTLTVVVVWFQFVVLTLVAPMLASDGISEERRTGALAALLTTPLTASQIVFGKLSSRLVQIFILSLLALPLLLSIRVFGGVSAEVLLAATAIILSTAMLGASLGLMCSLWTRRGGRAYSAAVQGLMLLGLVQFGPWIAEALRVEAFRRYGVSVVPIANINLTSSPLILGELNISAFGSELRTVHAALWPGGRAVYLGPAWVFNALYSLGLALIAAIFTSVMFRRSMLKLANEGPVPLRSRRWFRRSRKHSRNAPAAGQRVDGDVAGAESESLRESSAEVVRGNSRTVRGNPVLWREIRQPTMGSRRMLMLAVGCAGVVGGLLYWSLPLSEDVLHLAIANIGLLLAMAQSAYATSGSIASERDGRTWEALLSTPLTARQIVLAKFFGALRTQWFFPTLVLGHFIIAGFAGALQPVTWFWVVLIMIAPVVLLTATGQFIAIALRRSAMAAAANLILGFAVFLGPWIIVGGLGMFYWDEPLWFEVLGDGVCATNPVSLMTVLLVNDSTQYRNQYHLIYTTLSQGEFCVLLVGVFAGYLLLSAGVLALACRWFKRFTGRAS